MNITVDGVETIIKSCPFCGNDPTVTYITHSGIQHLRISHCIADTDPQIPGLAVILWNERAEQPQSSLE